MLIDTVLFYVFAVLVLGGAVLTITRRSAVHSAISLIVSLLGVAGLYLLQQAEFLFAVQIVLYIGGIMVLFLFVIMLVNVGAEEEGRAPIFNRPAQVTAALVFLAMLAGVLVIYAIPKGYSALKDRDKVSAQEISASRDQQQQKLPAGATGVSRITNDTGRVGGKLYTFASLPFEIASVLLLVAIIGSVMLARTLKQEVAADDVDPEVLKSIEKNDDDRP